MSEDIEELSAWDFPDTVSVPDGYDVTRIPDATSDNFNMLMEEHNKLVRAVNQMRGEK